jgi:hypothetical protein
VICAVGLGEGPDSTSIQSQGSWTSKTPTTCSQTEILKYPARPISSISLQVRLTSLGDDKQESKKTATCENKVQKRLQTDSSLCPLEDIELDIPSKTISFSGSPTVRPGPQTSHMDELVAVGSAVVPVAVSGTMVGVKLIIPPGDMLGTSLGASLVSCADDTPAVRRSAM